MRFFVSPLLLFQEEYKGRFLRKYIDESRKRKMSIKKKLFEKIQEYHQILKERAEIESETPGIPDSDLCEINDEYACLSSRETVVQDEIERLMLDIRGIPFDNLKNLSKDQIRDLKFFVKCAKLSYDVNIGTCLDYQWLTIKEEAKKRYKEIRPFMLAENLTPHIKVYYEEAIDCYKFGFFKASCVLCRPIIESIAERYIENYGKGDLLHGKNKAKKGRSIPDILKNELALPIEIIKLYSQIVDRADNILHKEGEKVTQKNALQAIKLLQCFIKKFPSTK